MSLLLHGDCLEHLHSVDDDSVDLIFCDLPYGQTSCSWDCKIDLTKLWEHFMRIKKLHTPLFFTTTTKFGCDLIQSAPKKCFFRYDLVWVKSAPAGFLSAKKMPMRKHEMVYVFYEKLPLYDLSSHQHKFINPNPVKTDRVANDKGCYGYAGDPEYKKDKQGSYNPPLPTSVFHGEIKKEGQIYNGGKPMKVVSDGQGPQYDPPLPVSVMKEPEPEPESDGAVSEGHQGIHGDIKTPEYIANNIKRNELRRKYKKEGKSESAYEPPLPVSVVKEDLYGQDKEYKEQIYDEETYGKAGKSQVMYDPKLPTSMLEIKSTRGKHSTEKPVALMSWILKYYSKEGDVVLDPTMGSGSTGVACKEMNRNFIGIEQDPEIYEVAVNRIDN